MDGFPRSAINRLEEVVAEYARRDAQERAVSAPETVTASPDRCADPSADDLALPDSGAGTASARPPEGLG